MQAIRRRHWIATRLKQLGKKKGGLASALGIDSARVSEILKGSRRVQVSELSKLADYLDMPEPQVASLLRGEASAKPELNNKVLDEEAERFNEQLRERLVEVRKGLGWSQARMASALRVPEANYATYETRSTLPMHLLPRLVHVSGRTFSWLLPGYG